MSEIFYFKVYDDLFECLETFTDEEVGRLMRAVAAYTFQNKTPDLSAPEDRALRIAWTIFRVRLDKDKELHEHLAARSRANGRLGGRPRKSN